ncbi:DUF6455 family protein [Primorskyibacter sp. S87]|uniref:DUF6455 family protein n=1 Tax=Primorskyibacter sp. S87 TaxID=3415126 RepID=UPI003C7C1A5B
MPDRATLKRHAHLLERMASTLKVDLQEEAIAGRVSIDGISDAVLRCTECPDPGHCVVWLSEHEAGSTDTPGFCRNRDLLRGLRG